MPSVNDSFDTAITALDTPEDILTSSGAGNFYASIDLSAMVGGATPDTIHVRVFYVPTTGATEEKIMDVPFTGLQTVAVPTPPRSVATGGSYTVEVEQTDGTLRNVEAYLMRTDG